MPDTSVSASTDEKRPCAVRHPKIREGYLAVSACQVGMVTQATRAGSLASAVTNGTTLRHECVSLNWHFLAAEAQTDCRESEVVCRGPRWFGRPRRSYHPAGTRCPAVMIVTSTHPTPARRRGYGDRRHQDTTVTFLGPPSPAPRSTSTKRSSPVATSVSIASSSPEARSPFTAPSSPAASSLSLTPSSPAVPSASSEQCSPAPRSPSAKPTSLEARSSSAVPSSPAAESPLTTPCSPAAQ
jgi:hypothetical protein